MNAITGSVTTGAAETTAVVNVGFTPSLIKLVKSDGSLMAEYVNGVTVASVKGTFAATFTLGVVGSGSTAYTGVTFGGLANATTYKYVIVR